MPTNFSKRPDKIANPGKYEEDKVTVGGKEYSYRDPDNFAKIQFDERGDDNPDGYMGTGVGNKDAKPEYNPLYAYNYGTIRDAASELGISNINKAREVEAILDFIKSSRKSDDEETDLEDVVEAIEEEKKNPFAPYDEDYQLSQHFQDINSKLGVEAPKPYEANEEDFDDDDPDRATKLFTRNYAADVAASAGLAPDRRLNLQNAMYTAEAFGKFHRPSGNN